MSGVSESAVDPWLGRLSAGWSIKRLGALGTLVKGRGGSKEDNRDAGVPVVRYGDLYTKFGTTIAEPAAFVSEEDASRYTPLPRHSIVFAVSGESAEDIGKSAMSLLAEPAVVGGDAVVFHPSDEIDSLYLAYALESSPVRAYKAIRSTGFTVVHISAGKLKTLPIPFPPRAEQRAIADYLDRETARIDTLIEEQQCLIDMLRERRRALSNRAVCFGIDEDVELRDSGDPMVGPVPRHWTVKAARHWLESLDGQRIPLSGEERADRRGDFDYYGASGVIDQVDDYLFDEPLVLVSEDGANLLMRSTPIAFAAKGRYWVNNHAHVLRPLGGGDVDFWAQRLEALDVTTVVSGAAQPKLTAGALMGLRVSAPDDIGEQRRIAAHLTEETSKIDTLIAETERFIELARERRGALITAAVTGQIDVREMG